MLAPLLAVAAATLGSDGRAGVWEGTVGSLPVRVCFADGYGREFGAYYYLAHRRTIALEPEERGVGAFRENDVRDSARPRWVVGSPDGDRLTGSWSHGRRRLAVNLQRVALADGEEGPCASLAFHAPRFSGVHTVPERGSIDGVGYTRLRLAGAEHFGAEAVTFELDGETDAERRINARLAEPLAGDPPEWFDCLRGALVQGPFEGDYRRTLAPVLATSQWLSVVDRFDHYCGGNHPNHGQAYLTFDRSTGAEIDLHDWLGSAAVRRDRPEWSEEDIVTLQPAFREIILAGWTSGEAECDEVVRDREHWKIALRSGGLLFEPDLPHAVLACGDSFLLSFDRLGLFLTEEAVHYVRELEAEVRP